MKSTPIKNLQVKEVMTIRPMTVLPHDTVDKVKDIFDTYLIHHIPVVDEDEKLLGIISHSDLDILLHWSTRLKLPVSDTYNDKLLHSTTAIELCSTHIMAVKPEDTLSDCFEIFKQNAFRSLPVINGEGKLIGIITPYDIMTIAINQ
jgi:CBS domain-containing protein